MTDYEGRHALVTGGGSGIGAATAAALQAAGADVTIVGRNAERLAEAAAAMGVGWAACDVTDREGVARAFAAAVAERGPIAILVNNAGAVEAAAFEKMHDAHWDDTLAVNLTGVYNCTRQVVQPMRRAGFGRIVNVASTAALKGYAYVSAYCAAKHGVVGLTRALALECATQGITVNAVCPGYTDTEIVSNAVRNIVAATGRSEDEAMAEILASNPQGRLIQPKEVADTVLWLCGQASMTGQAIALAGGEIM